MLIKAENFKLPFVMWLLPYTCSQVPFAVYVVAESVQGSGKDSGVSKYSFSITLLI